MARRRRWEILCGGRLTEAEKYGKGAHIVVAKKKSGKEVAYISVSETSIQERHTFVLEDEKEGEGGSRTENWRVVTGRGSLPRTAFKGKGTEGCENFHQKGEAGRSGGTDGAWDV